MSAIAAGALTDNLLPLAMVILAIGIGMWTLRNAQRRARQRSPARDLLDQSREERDVRRSMDTMMVELEEFARRVNAQIDTKAAKLEQLIRDADDRLSQLNAASGSPAARVAASASTARPFGANPADRPPAAFNRPAIDHVVDDSEEAPPPSGGVSSASQVRQDTSASGRLRPTDERSIEICSLADAGQTPLQIAQSLEMPVGEIELVLRLYGRDD
ncbi:MAG: hypothetical protein JXO22_12575 [Phycisphaerae bacterium]|nr:hypothetical protein [Phycisphaerae bacterium]